MLPTGEKISLYSSQNLQLCFIASYVAQRLVNCDGDKFSQLCSFRRAGGGERGAGGEQPRRVQGGALLSSEAAI